MLDDSRERIRQIQQKGMNPNRPHRHIKFIEARATQEMREMALWNELDMTFEQIKAQTRARLRRQLLITQLNLRKIYLER